MKPLVREDLKLLLKRGMMFKYLTTGVNELITSLILIPCVHFEESPLVQDCQNLTASTILKNKPHIHHLSPEYISTLSSRFYDSCSGLIIDSCSKGGLFHD